MIRSNLFSIPSEVRTVCSSALSVLDPFRRSLKNSLIGFALLFCTTLFVFLFQGCTAVVTPPASPEDPQTVYLADDAYHAALVLPVDGQTWVRYEYGEWHYFGRNRTGVFHALHAIAWPSDGTLGRRYLNSESNDDPLRERLQGTHVYEIQVSEDRVRALLQEFNASFQEKPETLYENLRRDLTLVRLEQNYWFFHDSNAEVVDWLQRLGCEVHGSSFLSNWRVKRKNSPPGN